MPKCEYCNTELTLNLTLTKNLTTTLNVVYPVPAAGTRSGGLPVTAAGTGYIQGIRSQQPGVDLPAFQSWQPGTETQRVSGPGSRDSIWGPSSPVSRN